MKISKFSRLLSILLCFAMIFSIAIQGVSVASAASTYENNNLMKNEGFENALTTSDWGTWQTASRTTTEHHSGSASGMVTQTRNGGASLEQDVAGLKAGVTYVLSAWVKASGTVSGEVCFGVKNYGGEQKKVMLESDSDWKQVSIEFTYSGSQSARVFLWHDGSSSSKAYVDDITLVSKGGIMSAEVANGSLDVTVDNTTATAEAFTATIESSLNAGVVNNLPLTGTVANGVATLTFAAVEASPVEQTITVKLTYGEQTITLDYVVEANGESLVTANIASVSATNGTATVVLDNDPTVAPVASDFALTVNETATTIKDFSYDRTTKTATLTFKSVVGNPVSVSNVNVTVAYNGVSKSATFTVEKSTAVTYYVSNSGNDNNDGLTEATAIATIDKLNSLELNPGDKILLKSGDTFTGTFRPTDSGVEGYPITLSSYGEGARPIWNVGEAFQIPAMMSAGGQDRNAMVSSCIYLYNVEYWEVSNLELVDPSYDASFYAVNSLTTYVAGIRVVNENMGDLHHFYFDNLSIHGFRGPGTNLGKTAGGIQFNTYINLDDDSVNVPSALVDMRITNCEIYEVGRSGINFLNPWALRRGTDDKWSTANYGTKTFYPHRDFYLANTTFHDIDGDALIVDNVSNAVVEKNLCYRAATHLGSMGAAVGFFNWNSDDTYFQFNEVYDTGLNATQNNGSYTLPGDAQGIEVDALNDRTWVQYNYVHDNLGGFMMWCNVGNNYRGFDAIVRYNISESDYNKNHGIFHPCGFEYGSETYNNVFYLDENSVMNNGTIRMFNTTSSAGKMKIYNNIFYYNGETAKAANTFADNNFDWRSNIFYGFTNLPQNDDAANPNFSADPLFVNPGQGVNGSGNGIFCEELNGYKLSANSPAIDKAVYLASMEDETGNRDFFGNKLTKITDIGVYETGSICDKVMSTTNVLDAENNTVTVANGTTAKELVDSLVYESNVIANVSRNDIVIDAKQILASGDVLTVSDANYTVTVADGEQVINYVPTDIMTATAGSSETASASDIPANVLDGDTGTMWHTAWAGADRSLHYITLALTQDYSVTAFEYTPRVSQTNGVITKYNISGSNDNSTWTTIAEGTWAADNTVKTVTFDAVTYKYYKLTSVESVSDGANQFSSAAEIRLVGDRIGYTPDAPQGPQNVTAKANGTYAEISWTAPENAESIVNYIIKNGSTTLATVKSTETSVIVNGLTVQTAYTLSVYALSDEGIMSNKTDVTFTTTDDTSTPDLGYGDDVVLGDVNKDGKVNATDATLILQHYANIETKVAVDNSVADVNKDGNVNATDATLVLQYYAGIIVKL